MCGESRMHGVGRGKRVAGTANPLQPLPIVIVYGIAITAMSFFTDPTISTLTSGTPSQNVDLQGMSFPRSLGVRFNQDFIVKYHLAGMQCRWMSYEDQNFTKDMGKDFAHEDTISREGWAKYYFKGKYPKDVAFVRLQIVNPQTGMLVRTFYFQFRKSYQTSLDARYYITDPILGDKIVKNGVLVEMRQFKTPEGKIVYRKAKTTFKQEKILDVIAGGDRVQVDTQAITRTQVRYAEKPKMVFLVEYGTRDKCVASHGPSMAKPSRRPWMISGE